MMRPEEVEQRVNDDLIEASFLAEGKGYEAHLALWEEMRRLVEEYPRWAIFKELCEREAQVCFDEFRELRHLHDPDVQERAIMLRERANTLRWIWSEPEHLASEENHRTWLQKLEDVGDRLAEWWKSKRNE